MTGGDLTALSPDDRTWCIHEYATVATELRRGNIDTGAVIRRPEVQRGRFAKRSPVLVI